MAKNKEDELTYKEEGLKRNAYRKAKRKQKLQLKEDKREARRKNCCEGMASCNGTTDCMWY